MKCFFVKCLFLEVVGRGCGWEEGARYTPDLGSQIKSFPSTLLSSCFSIALLLPGVWAVHWRVLGFRNEVPGPRGPRKGSGAVR